MNNDKKTSIAGTIAGVGLGANVDFTKIGDGDVIEIAKLVSAVAITVLGFFANRNK